MTEAFSSIWHYISANHVISITVSDKKELWSFNAFYACNIDSKTILIMTNELTKHGTIMQSFPIVSGTISDQSEDVKKLQGVQFLGSISPVNIQAQEVVKKTYIDRFPYVAKMKLETLWELRFTYIKYTDNAEGFGTKKEWKRD